MLNEVREEDHSNLNEQNMSDEENGIEQDELYNLVEQNMTYEENEREQEYSNEDEENMPIEENGQRNVESSLNLFTATFIIFNMQN